MYDTPVSESLDIMARVWETLQQRCLLDVTKRLLLAVSGGADSLFLMHILQGLVQHHHLPLDLVCVHLNHQLRGTDAEEDESFVRQQAKVRGLTFVSECLPVAAYAAKHGLSVETAARLCRMERLTALAHQHRCTTIATGHHLDDNVETVLFRLLRGTGYRGLAGIHPVRTCPAGLRWIRPLLCLTRAEIRAHLQDQGIAWREDRTNRDTSIKRNFIRHRLLPRLEDTAARPLAPLVADLADAAYRMQQRVECSLTSLWTDHTHRPPQGEARLSIPRDTLRDVPPWLRAAWLQRALEALGCGQRHITRDHYGYMESALVAGTAAGVHTLPQGFSLRVIDDQLVLCRPSAPCVPVKRNPTRIWVPGVTHWGPHAIVATLVSERAPSRSHPSTRACRRIEQMDADTIKGPLVVRQRCPGDRFVPLGGSGSRKVGKFLSDTKPTQAKRAQVAIVMDQEKIVWVAPFRLSEHVKLTDATQRILQLEFRIA